MENIQFQLSNDTKKKIINFINNFYKWYTEFSKKVYRIFENIYNSIDWDKYKRNLKYQKRVKNREALFAKRKCKYRR